MKKILLLIVFFILTAGCNNSSSGNKSDNGEDITDNDIDIADIEEDDNNDETVDSDMAEEDPNVEEGEKISINFSLMNPSNNSGLSGIMLSYGDQQTESDNQGKAVINVEPGKYFDVKGEKEGFQNYHFLGVSGGSDFTFFTYVSSRAVTNQVLGMLSQTLDEEKGFVVVGVDYKNMAPVYGAEVEISSDHSEPFIFSGSGMPQNGSVLEEGGGSFVSFPNTEIGKVTIKVIPPDGVTCSPYPSGDGEEVDIDVYEDSVSVIAFVCE